jgi:nucleoside-diphosphate-sugar epimerase
VKGVEVLSIPERDIDNIRRRMIDIEKIHQRLGWTPRIGIQKGIELTIDWYKSTIIIYAGHTQNSKIPF